MHPLRLAAGLLVCVAPLPTFGQSLNTERVYPRFAVGPTGIYATLEAGLTVTVTDIAPGSAAEGSGLRAGDVLLAAGDLLLAVEDPRVPLGQAIGRAEAADGRLRFDVRREGAALEAALTLPALGPYAESWPQDCAKSTAIIAATAEYVAGCQEQDGAYRFGAERPERDGLSGCLAGLFLLSTGEARYLASVRLQVRALCEAIERRPTTSNWHLGYQGILLAEYYLRTGDEGVLAALATLCEQALFAQAAGGWGHAGPPGPGYTQSGLMNSAGLPVLTTLTLARECGVEVDDGAYRDALMLVLRMAGHGCIPYGDHRSELWWSNTNGRNAQLACGLFLIEDARCRQAAEHLALLVTDSYFQPEFGHTGGGFNVVWRGLASVHVPAPQRYHYRRQMRELAWYYDLCRQPGGGFSILPTPPDNKRYQGLAWGTGAIGLTYTAPLATLRITGAPRTRFSKRAALPALEWGTPADLQFLATDHAAGFGEESADPREVYTRLLSKEKGPASVEFAARHLLHYSPLVRSWAARLLNEKGDPRARAALAEAASHPDPRVRRAAFDGVSGYDNWGRPMRGRLAPELVSEEFLPAISKTLHDPESAWWELDGALFALGRAKPADIRAHRDLVLAFGRHEEWYLREAAFWALVGLGEAITGEEFGELGAIYARSRHVFERSSYDAGFRVLLRQNLAALDRASREPVVRVLGRSTHDPLVADGYGEAGVHEAAHRAMMVLKHFGPSAYPLLLEDFETYLESWTPYYQHSVWLISGSKWQPGLLAVLEALGAEGRPLYAQLRRLLERFEEFDPQRIGGEGKDLESKLREALDAWRELHGERR